MPLRPSDDVESTITFSWLIRYRGEASGKPYPSENISMFFFVSSPTRTFSITCQGQRFHLTGFSQGRLGFIRDLTVNLFLVVYKSSIYKNLDLGSPRGGFTVARVCVET